MTIAIAWELDDEHDERGEIDLPASVAKLEALLATLGLDGDTKVILKVAQEFGVKRSVPGKAAGPFEAINRIVDSREWVVRLPPET